MNEVIDFLLHVAASTLGILVGAWIARKGEDLWNKYKYRHRR